MLLSFIKLTIYFCYVFKNESHKISKKLTASDFVKQWVFSESSTCKEKENYFIIGFQLLVQNLEHF